MFKLGLAWEPNERFKAGITITPPNAKLFGKGELLNQVVLNGRPGGGSSFIGRTFQQGLSTHWRNPLTISAGAEYQITSAWAFALQLDYWSSLEAQDVLSVDQNQVFNINPAFAGQSRVGTGPVMVDKRRTVVNVSAGTEYRFNPTYAGYLGFWTDFSPYSVDTVQGRDLDYGFSLAFSTLDIYNVIFGLTRRTEKTLVGVGLNFSWGSGVSPGNLDFVSDAGATNRPGRLADNVDRTVSLFTTSLLIGFTYFL